ncbi:MAG: alpha-E domain-containing protein [Granulosicoccus sp.]|nr:alpha-E domain-containing protein [Granulosicoccus sp.]
MLARVAENIYWLSRYLERAENTVRLINVHSNLLMDLPTVDDHQGWIPLISINGLDEEFAELHDQASESTVNHFLLADKTNPGSLRCAFQAIQINLRSCRDIIPKASYEAINSLCRFVLRQIDGSHAHPAQRLAFLRTVEERLLAISGGLNSNMSHDLGYRFMRLGCYLERADMTSRIIDVQSTRLSALHTTREIMAIQAQRWVSVLRSLAAHQMYRQSVRRPVNGTDTLTFLLTDLNLPRSYSFCINHLDECLQWVGDCAAASEAVAVLKRQLDAAVYESLARDPDELHLFLDKLQLGMLDVGAAINATYFPPPAPIEEPDTAEPTASIKESE